MTAAAVAPVKTPVEIRRARYLGVTYLLLAVLVLWLFAFGSMDYGHATWGLARANDPVLWGGIDEVSFSASGLAFVVAGLMAMAGGVQLWRGFGKWSSVVLAVALVLFILAFLAWATARSSQGSFSMVGMLQATVLRSVPITFGALSGVLCERVAVINIAIEGMLLGGAFVAVVVGSSINVAEDYLILGAPVGSWIGVAVAMLSGAVLAWALAVLAIRYRVDQIIVGVVINIFVLGLTSFLALRILVENPDFNKAAIFKALQVPGLSRIPLIGPILFAHNIFVYAMFLLVAMLTFGLFRTRWGLRARAVGEHPKAADTLGINVYRMRYLNVLLGGLMAGFGGAYFTVGSVGRFDENMTNGRGYIGLAAMIFGRWHPVGALAAGLVFGFADALSQKLGILQTPIPSEFLGMAPFLATILVVAGLVGKARPPAADGQPYIKE